MLASLKHYMFNFRFLYYNRISYNDIDYFFINENKHDQSVGDNSVRTPFVYVSCQRLEQTLAAFRFNISEGFWPTCFWLMNGRCVNLA